MFRSRRASLIQQLWRHRCVAPGLDESHGPLKPAAHALFKKLKDQELELLLQAVASKGAGESGCVWVEPRGSKLGLPASLLLCRLYRWPDLRHPHELKRLSFCKSAGAEGTIQCCNPHHLSRLTIPETPLPPYGKISPFAPHLKGPPSILDNNCRGWQDTTLSRRSLRDGYWCKLAYWEYRLRVGRLYPVHEDYVNVFFDLPASSGFCLGQLPSRNRCQAVQRTRAKIGQGLLLSREANGIWAYNRSDHPVFVCSPTLGAPPASSGPIVQKILPGYSIKVFDYERAGNLVPGWPGSNDGPYDTHAVRISFTKGWGPHYSRRFITSCPCWMEVLLNTPR
ncbi:mothers against decapentaplegic homolog 6-like isoform X2 [Sceloporus undulatus]|nr:mothers against decapentaplegic homolog 6-like isoform X2 [Sceloporus undulatus]XP_042296569.1 mothers against decapentaplegic homolog 6-like isoform X2 [Sceloporus undulatus]XP_042296570.1 mothers against decapentaplegic homolog 6-like isoform X2 [Sceloporus undulatus]